MRCALAAITVLALSSCGGRQGAARVVGTFLECEAPNLAATVSDLVPLGIAALQRRIAGDGTVDMSGLKSDLAAIGSDLGRCALAAAAVAMTTESGVARSALTSERAVSFRAAFTRARGELAWPVVHVWGTTL